MPAGWEPWPRGLARPEQQREERLPCAYSADPRPAEMKGVFPVLGGETARAHGAVCCREAGPRRDERRLQSSTVTYGDQAVSPFPLNL